MDIKRKNPAGGRVYRSGFSKRNYNNSFEKINDLALSSLSVLLNRWLPDGKIVGHEYIALNPTRSDQKAGSFKVNMNTGKWSDFATGDKGGDVISLAAYLFNLSQVEAKRNIEKMMGVRHV